jgi:hypothetical protein
MGSRNMPHDWIFDVLRDLQAYARQNGLPRLAEVAEEALDVAREEVAERSDNGNPPPFGRPN